MTTTWQRLRPRAARWGWGVSLALYALLLLNAGFLFFFEMRPAIFEQDTGLTLTEVEQAFPSVVRYLTFEVRLATTLLAGVSVMALLLALTGLRTGSRQSWRVLWVPLTLLAAIAAALFANQRPDIAVFYVAYLAIALVGQLLAAGGLEGR